MSHGELTFSIALCVSSRLSEGLGLGRWSRKFRDSTQHFFFFLFPSLIIKSLFSR
jgi:hypothetical protein